VPELWTVLASGAQTHGAYTVTAISSTKGNTAGPMKYKQHDEIYYVLAGRGTIMLNERVQAIEKNDFVYIPQGTVFALRADSEDEMLRLLVIHTPSGIIEGSLSFLGAIPAEDRTKPPQDLVNPGRSLEEAMAYLKSLGIDILAVADPLETSQ
jgi:mannose-6-phosphate isomerase-like protein (cupin superfamily)